MRPYPFLDFPCADLVTNGSAITFYCRCGHKHQMESREFGRWPTSSLHKVCRKMRCSACGAVGDIERLTVSPEHTGGVGRKTLGT